MKIKIDRLKLLAYYLASVPTDEFNLISWTRCAIGWATQIPEFATLGLKMGEFPCMPVYRTYANWHAVEKFFGLTDPQAQYLFSMYKYDDQRSSPMTVVRRLKRFIKGAEKQ